MVKKVGMGWMGWNGRGYPQMALRSIGKRDGIKGLFSTVICTYGRRDAAAAGRQRFVREIEINI
jgi:hypothetical protein